MRCVALMYACSAFRPTCMMHRSSVTGLNRDNRLPAHEYTIHLVSKVSSLVFRMHVPYVAPAGSCTSPDTQPYSHGVGPAYSTVRALRYFPSSPHCPHQGAHVVAAFLQRVDVLHCHDVLCLDRNHGIPSLGFPLSSSPLPWVPTLSEVTAYTSEPTSKFQTGTTCNRNTPCTWNSGENYQSRA